MFASLSSYDPETVDTSYIQEVSKQIPKNNSIDLYDADRLATIFLQCADQVTDEIARCSAYAGYCEAFRREKKADAIEQKITGVGGVKVAGTIATQTFGNDSVYGVAHRKQVVAEAFLEWLKTKYRNLMAAHVLCKDIMKAHVVNKDQGGWKSIHPHDLDSDDDDLKGESLTSNQDRNFGVDEW